MSTTRRQFVSAALATSAALVSRLALGDETSPSSSAGDKKPAPPENRRGPRQDLALVQEFVGAGHRDLKRVQEMVAEHPKLVLASWDQGAGDWETALNGAAHTGQYEIVEFLLSKGARIDHCCAAMLAQRDAVLALIAARPSVATTDGPHALTFLYHAAIGGDVAIADAIKPHLAPEARDFNQSLSAAARSGRLEMTQWLLKNGVTNVNFPDVFKKTPLAIALGGGFNDVADVLRAAGGRETP